MPISLRKPNATSLTVSNARTGARIWADDYPTGYVDDFGFDPGPRATPTIAEGRVYTFGCRGNA